MKCIQINGTFKQFSFVDGNNRLVMLLLSLSPYLYYNLYYNVSWLVSLFNSVLRQILF